MIHSVEGIGKVDWTYIDSATIDIVINSRAWSLDDMPTTHSFFEPKLIITSSEIITLNNVPVHNVQKPWKLQGVYICL